MSHAATTATDLPYRHIRVEPTTGSLGAELSGLDLRDIDDNIFDEIYRAFVEYQVIFFRDQTLTPDQFISFATCWGGIHYHPFMKGLDSHPEILELLKTETDTKAFGNAWHSDQMFTAIPAKCTILYALEMPAAGGDTMFASMYDAYETLSPGMQAMLAGLKAWNLGDRHPGIGGQSRHERHAGTISTMEFKDPGDVQTESLHPVVRTHPDCGRKALFVGGHTAQFENMTREESEPLLDYLKKHALTPEFTCRFRWRVGSLAIWDNRCTQHYAIDDYAGQRRRMHRITIKGDEAPY